MGYQSNQMMMFEEEQQMIQSACDQLAKASNALAVLCIDKNGQEIARSGTTEHLDVTSLSSLFAGNVAATGGIARISRSFKCSKSRVDPRHISKPERKSAPRRRRPF